MITVKVLLGKDTVSIYRKTGDISSVESTAESGGYVITRHFETWTDMKTGRCWLLPLRRKLRSAKGNLSG